MDEHDDSTGEKSNAVFNMALDTLRRLGEILSEIKKLEYRVDIPLEQRQQIKIGLVKQLFVQASPLLPDKTVKEYKDEVLKFKCKIINVLQSRPFLTPINLGPQLVYDDKLAFRLDEVLIEFQQILQKNGYFMPTSDDMGDSYN